MYGINENWVVECLFICGVRQNRGRCVERGCCKMYPEVNCYELEGRIVYRTKPDTGTGKESKKATYHSTEKGKIIMGCLYGNKNNSKKVNVGT